MTDHKQAEIASRTPDFMAAEAAKPFGWDAAHFVEWATVTEILRRLGIEPGASAIDVGCGIGWTTLFLAEAGIDAVGLDLVPANIEMARERAARWGSTARFEVADMDALPGGPPADLALVFDALHHTRAQRATLDGIFRRLKPGGWLVLAEPTWLHRLSPEARPGGRLLRRGEPGGRPGRRGPPGAPPPPPGGARGGGGGGRAQPGPAPARAKARPARGGVGHAPPVLPAHPPLRGPDRRLHL